MAETQLDHASCSLYSMHCPSSVLPSLLRLTGGRQKHYVGEGHGVDWLCALKVCSDSLEGKHYEAMAQVVLQTWLATFPSQAYLRGARRMQILLAYSSVSQYLDHWQEHTIAATLMILLGLPGQQQHSKALT